MNPDLSAAVAELADRTRLLPDSDLNQPWAWRAHKEGVRFALIGAYHDLRELAVYVRARRRRDGPDRSRLQDALAQYHLGYRELEATLLQAPHDDWTFEPRSGEWTVHKALGHIAATERWFFALIKHGADRFAAGEDPAELPDDYVDQVTGEHARLKPLVFGDDSEALWDHYANWHARVLHELQDIDEDASEAATLWWEEQPLSLLYRVHRLDAHLRQHTVQIEKALDELGRRPTEAQRLLRLVYGALAEVEGALIGAEALADDPRIAEVADAIRDYAADASQAAAVAAQVVEAASRGDLTELGSLLEAHPAACDAVSADGVSAVLAALYNRQTAAAELLIEAGADVWVWEAAALGRVDELEQVAKREGAARWLTARSPDGFTPLHLAAFFGQADAVDWLLAHDVPVDPEAANEMSVTPLHSAVAGGNVAIVTALLKAGADPDARQAGGYTALHGAAQAGNLDMLRALLEHGAEPDVKADNGMTPAKMAPEDLRDAVMDVLEA